MNKNKMTKVIFFRGLKAILNHLLSSGDIHVHTSIQTQDVEPKLINVGPQPATLAQH